MYKEFFEAVKQDIAYYSENKKIMTCKEKIKCNAITVARASLVIVVTPLITVYSKLDDVEREFVSSIAMKK